MSAQSTPVDYSLLGEGPPVTLDEPGPLLLLLEPELRARVKSVAIYRLPAEVMPLGHYGSIVEFFDADGQGIAIVECEQKVPSTVVVGRHQE